MPSLNRTSSHSCSPATEPKPRATSEPSSSLTGVFHVHNALTAPPSFSVGNFDIAWATSAAHHVSGDFVLHFQHQGFHYVALGDLMGKGLSAAMWLTHVIDLLQRACESHNDLSSIMRALNHEFHRSRVGVPLTTLLLTRISEDEPRVSYCCAGCPPLFLLSSDHRVSVLHEGGPILGALPESQYKSDTLTLCPADTLIALSDGISEAYRGRELEVCRYPMIDHLQCSPGNTAASIAAELISRIETFPSDPTDDGTVLAMHRSI